MSDEGLRLAREKMRAAGVSPAAIEVFTYYYRQLEAGVTGLVGEDTISALVDVPHLDQIEIDPKEARDALSRTALIKLNGGLATTMGLSKAKSLLTVRDGQSFLDLIVAQVRHARAKYQVTLPLILMNSFRTRDDSLQALAVHPDIAVPGLPLDFLQNQAPKLLVEDLTPVVWPADPTLEWCPPGHGDIYTALLDSGVLQALIDRGFRYAATANSDNLGAVPNAQLAGWFAASGASYACELTRRTPADRKGGHLAVRRRDGRLILRDTAQTAPEDYVHFTDERRHPYVHTNNLWLDLQALYDALTRSGAVLGLPLIRNVKTVDPTDPSSPAVYQLETAMGAAIEVFPDARAIVVDRGRFLPVKTTNDLLLVSSDAYELPEDALLRLVAPEAPHIALSPKYYATIADFEARFPAGPPSLRHARSLNVLGDWTFGSDVMVVGDAELPDGVLGGRVADGARIGQSPNA